MEKHCKACDRTLSLMDFYGATTGRISSKCKDCTKEYVKANRLVRIDYYREYDRKRGDRPDRVEARSAYQATEQGKQAGSRAKRRYAERNPDKRIAVNMVNNAIRDGKLPRRPCEVCGAERAQAHHDDYSKPLDVRWLCAKHHAEHHKAMRRSAA